MDTVAAASSNVDTLDVPPATPTHDEDRTGSTSSRPTTDRLRALWPAWRDASAVLLLVAVTWHLIPRDGGRSARDLLPVLIMAAIALLACRPQMRAASRPVQLLAIGWALSPLVAVAAAPVRAGMARPVMVSAIAVPARFHRPEVAAHGFQQRCRCLRL